ncbi:serine/threonine-protein kinase, partial [Roseisolibacter sp. H3M3-2]|uniref:serine/threonine-protein kinase n=1 Tax=Roseisolibacter sp. H3M3-2 TaxID=3031323 RepID=UPI0023D9BF82
MEHATDRAPDRASNGEATGHCPRCGASVAAGARFCSGCGARQGAPDAAAADPPLARARAAFLVDYEVTRELGHGRSSAVYLARDLRLARRVALKVLLPDHAAASPEAGPRFLAEARTAAALDHPHVLPVYHAGEQDGLRFLAMKPVDGGSLARLLDARGALPLSVACHLLAGVAAGLAYAHAQGVAHGDLRPANVLLDARHGRALVADVGLTPAHAPDAADRPFLAPERRAGDPATVAADQYAFGVLLRRLLGAGAPPILLALSQRLTAASPADRGPPLAELVPRLEAEAARVPGHLGAELRALLKDGAA